MGAAALGALLSLAIPSTPARAEEGGDKDKDKDGGARAERCDCAPDCVRTAPQLVAEMLGVPADAALLDQAGRQGFALDQLLATVPDPLRSNFGFDQYLDAIERALEEAGGYTLDRFWLPWRGPGSGDKAADRGCQQRFPGVLLFRHVVPRQPPQPGDTMRLLVISLIGETPTAGVYQAAFDQALQDAGAIRGQALKDGPPLRLLGPTFSGSALSLRIATERHRDLRFDIVSGSATNRQNQALLAGGGDRGVRVRYRATVHPDDSVEQELFRYLRDKLGARVISDGLMPTVAVLSESTTSYGQGLADATRSGGLRPRLVVPYPIHIARLRSAWRKDSSTRASTEENAPRLSLPRFRDDSDRGDIPPILAEGTVSRDDLALASLMRALSKEGVRYVGLYTLDSEDKVFLAQQLRKFCPDVRLFTLESDIIDTHPEVADVLRGMLVGSTYPLFTRNQLWTPPYQGRKRRLQFTSDGAHGVYNATLALLGEAVLLEYGRPSLLTTEAPDPPPPYPAGPPIWISAVGDDTLVPLEARWQPGDDRGYLYLPGPLPANARWPAAPATGPLRLQYGLLEFISELLGIFSLVVVLGYFLVSWRPRLALSYPLRLLNAFVPFRRGDRLPPAYRPLGATEASWQRFYLFVVFLTLSCACGCFDLLWTRLGMLALGRLNLLVLLTLALASPALVLALGHVLFQMVRALMARPRRIADPAWVLGLCLALTGVTAALGVRLGSAITTGADPAPMLLLSRLGNPIWGLSPAPPLVLLGAAASVWAYLGLRRICLLGDAWDVRGVELMRSRPERGASLPGDGRSSYEMLRSMTQSPWAAAIVFLGSLLLLAPAFIRLLTLEGRCYELVYVALFIFVFASVARSHLRFVVLWYQFQRFLRDLAAGPMAEAYSRLPPQFSRSVGMLLLERIPVEREVDALWRHFSLLVNHFSQFERQLLQQAVGVPAAALADLRRVIARGKRFESKSAEKKKVFFLDVSRALLAVLGCFWGRRPLRSALGEKPPVKESADLPTTNTAALYMRLLPDEMHLWLRLAEDFVAIQVVGYISHIFPLLRGALISSVVGMILLLVSVSFYPFQPQHLLMSAIWALILLVVAVTLVVLVQMNLDEVLSRIAKNEPGRVTWDRLFITPVAIYVVLPILSLVASQLPELRGFLTSWIVPFLRALK